MSRTDLDGATRLYGILGHPVSSSLSPAMHNAAFRSLGLNAAYVPFPVQPEKLEEAVTGLIASGIAGFNLTVPHKVAILPLLSDLSPEAREVGAVNTVRVDPDGLHGTNTDGDGFLMSLEEELGWKPAGKRVALLGAGGAARGLAGCLLREGVDYLMIANRTVEKAQALAEEFGKKYPGAKVEAGMPGAWNREAPGLLINSTTVGMGDQAAPVQLESGQAPEGVVDIVYSPLETPLLSQARSLGLPAVNGLGMLLYQGVLAFRFWTGQEPPVAIMREALLAGLAARGS